MASDLLWQSSSAPTHGTIGDINTMRVNADYLGYAQDVIVDVDGVLRSRGAFNSITADTFTNLVCNGAVQTLSGTGLAMRDTGGDSYWYGTSAAALTGFAKLTTSGYGGGGAQSFTSQGCTYTFAKTPGDQGAIIAGDNGFVSTQLHSLAIWGGNSVTTSDTTAGTGASTIGSKAIAGVGTAWTTALEGCYLFIGAGAAAIYVGQVDQVTSTTTLLLKKGALKTIAAAAPAFKTVRPIQYLVYKGRITTNTASAVVVGSNTKFISSGPAGSGSVFLTNSVSNVFRYSDGAFVGAITSVQNDGTLTLTGNAAIAMTNEEYYISNPQFAVTTAPTFLAYAGSVAKFADRYWYGSFSAADPSVKATNTSVQLITVGPNSVLFSKKNDPECLDLDPAAGDIITLPTGNSSDRIRCLVATRGGLVVFRTYDTFLITGYSPETFRAIKILDDGVPLSLTAQAYKEGVIWAGFKSIWYFDGTKIVDLLQDSVRKFYQRALPIASGNFPITVATALDNVLVSYNMSTASDKTWPYKNTTKSMNLVTININLLNGAVSFFTNICATTSFYSPNFASPIIVSRSGGGLINGTSFLLRGNTIYQDSSAAADNFDSVTGAATFTSGTQIGPDVMWETTKLTMGDASRIKFWKRCLMNYSSDVSMTAMMTGSNDTTLDFPNRSTGTASTDVLAASANAGILHRLRFLVRSPTLVIRFYQTSTTSATSQRFKCFWWAVGGKKMRQGRVQP